MGFLGKNNDYNFKWSLFRGNIFLESAASEAETATKILFIYFKNAYVPLHQRKKKKESLKQLK